MDLKPTYLLEGLCFPEGPRWHGDKLWFSDMHRHRVMTVDLEGKSQVLFEINDRPSGLGFLPEGDLLAVSMYNRRLLRWDGRAVRTEAAVPDIDGDCLNDMVVDHLGRAYVGNRFRRVGAASSSAGKENVILVTPGGEKRVVAQDVEGPNGTAITPDGKTLILSEIQAHRLTAFDILPDGSLTNRRVHAELGQRWADGICLDAEGGIWCGSPRSQEFFRVLPGGTVTDILSLENRWGVACVLGGPDRRTLFLCTAETSIDEIRDLEREIMRGRPEADRQSKAVGRIEIVRVDVPGAGIP